ncbi:MAG: hypothetical protein JWO56_1157, partial [Acidobacteria bacterium]|nr:hypothetical protein [Acidobacteriota bacterium]
MRINSSRIFVLAAVVSAAFHPVARGDVHCLESDTPRQCLQRISVEHAALAAQKVAADAPTGDNVSTSPARSALKDFLTAASSQLTTSTLTENKDESLALAYNLPFDLLGANRQIRVEAVFMKPKLSPAVASVAGVKAPAIEKGLSAADNVVFDLSFNPVTRRFGRSIAPHRKLLESLLGMPAPPGADAAGAD